MACDHPCACCCYYTVSNPGCHEQCPVCGWTDGGAYNDEGSVWLDEAQRNFAEIGACARVWLASVTPPSAGLRRAAPPHTLDEWRCGLRADFIGRAREVFGSAPRPRHFTSRHCDECIEHDEVMGQYDNDTLTFEPFTNPGWDPRCFLTGAGFRYFMPGLLRVQIERLQVDAASAQGWYDVELIDFHLRDAEDSRFALFSAAEVELVATFLASFLKCPGFAGLFLGANEIERAAESWKTRASRKSGCA